MILTFEGLTNVHHITNLLTFVTIGDNKCTTVRILTKHFCNMKIVMHIFNSLVKPIFINSLLM